MTESARSISGGDLSRRIPVSGHDEIGVLTALALGGLVAVAVVTRALVIPVNKRIHALDAESTSPDTLRAVDEAFRPLHRRWAELHAIRMLCALTSFVCFTLALALA